MICEDFVMLGKTVPEPVSDGRIFVCSAGYSPEMRQLIRIYPLARHGAPHRWTVSRVPLERNPKDSRPESWKLAGDRSLGSHERINEVITPYSTLTAGEKLTLLANADEWVASINEANERRLSLALIRPKNFEVIFDENRLSPDSPQLKLFDDGLPEAEGAKRFPYIPRLRFIDGDGTERKLMIRDWGAYELMRKHPEYTFDMEEALWLGDDSTLLVGNFNSHRHSWLIISVLNIGSQQMSLDVAS